MRDQSIDIYKGLLIFLVVFGHFLERLLGWQDTLAKIFLQNIYVLHMPAFVFISGYLFKDQNISQKLKYFLSLMIPFQLFYVLLDAYYTGQFSSKWLWQPYWLLWYLWAMLAWVILTHWLKQTAYPVVLSLLLALLIGLSPINNYLFSVGRIFNFLPFFMLGHVYGKARLDILRRLPFTYLIAVIAIVGLLGLTQLHPLKSYWLYGSLSYTQMHIAPLQGMLIRSQYLIMSCCAVFAWAMLAGKLPQFLSQLGQASLSIYLWHGLIVLWLSHIWHVTVTPPIQLLIAFCASILTCWVCMLPIFQRSIQMLSNGFLWLFTKIIPKKTEI
ncbi:acyltransferase [Serratia sp. S1B]|nr:acyltransferase [Serratia sp. S1B]